MNKYKVTVANTWVNGVKVRRGDIIELPNDDGYGTQLELVNEAPAVEPVIEEAPKPKRTRRVKKHD